MYVPLVILLAALFCTGGGAGDFVDLPFDTKTHLISHHTEGNGEDREIPLMSVPVSTLNTLTKVDVVDFNACPYSSFGTITKADVMDLTASGDMHSYLPEMREEDQFTFEALPGYLLDHYFSQKADHTAVSTFLSDTMLEYGNEGCGSPTGSLGCCSDLGSDDDLQFLDNLGSKFITLAEICGYSRETITPTTEVETSAIVHTNDVKLQRSISSVEEHSPRPLPNMHLHETVTMPTQTAQVPQQQPVYYMVEPQVQSTVLLAERPPMALAQGMILVNGSQAATEGVLLQGGGLVQGAQRLVMAQGGHVQGAQGLVVAQGGHVQCAQGLIVQQGGHVQEAQNLVVAQGGHIQGAQGLVLQQAGPSRAQGLVVQQEGHTQGAKEMIVQGLGPVHTKRRQSLIIPQGGNIQGAQGFITSQGGYIQGAQGLILQQNGYSHRPHDVIMQQGGYIKGEQGIIIPNDPHSPGSPETGGLFLVNSGQATTMGLVHQEQGLVQGAQMVVMQEDQLSSPGSPGMLLIDGRPPLGPGSPFSSQPLHAPSICGSSMLPVNGGIRRKGEIRLNTMPRHAGKTIKRRGANGKAQSLSQGPVLQGGGHILMNGSTDTQMVIQEPASTGQMLVGQRMLQQQLEVSPKGEEQEVGTM